MSDSAAGIDVESTAEVVAPKLPGGATLPFPPTPSASVAGRTLQESTYAQRVTPPRLHEDSPNIVIVLIDDAGPGLPTTFGGEVRTATMDRICAEGLSYNRFHTTAMCSPRGAAMSDGTADLDVESTGGVVAPKLPGGATLPFPPTPSASVAGRTLQESTYAQRVTPPRLH